MEVTSELEKNGFAIIPKVVSSAAIEKCANAVETIRDFTHPGIRHKDNKIYAIRHLLQIVPQIKEFLLEIDPLLQSILGKDYFTVQSILFDKIPKANWQVFFHQDITIPVCAKKEIPNFGPWSCKAGVLHVVAPAKILEKILILRIHLDETDNAPLKVIAGSHCCGILSNEQIQSWLKQNPITYCQVPKGGVLAMKPLLLHGSSPSQNPQEHRRVIHLEFATESLPQGLEWYRY